MDGRHDPDRSCAARPRRLGRVLMAAGIALAGFQLLYLAGVAIAAVRLREHNPADFSLAMIRRRQTGHPGEPLRHVTLDQIPMRLLHTLILIEDPRFADHRGFDTQSIRYAIELNSRHGRIVYGGSTITQQLARTILLFPRQLYVRKVLEVQAAIILDAVLPKERVLELYVNYAEWGPGVHGIGAAAHYHYAAMPAELDDVRLAGLIAIMPSPLRYCPETFHESPMLAARHRLALELLDGVDVPQNRIRVDIRRTL
ncbi:MAG: hypothetical protein EA382_16710 [Spirochaetaceae bacterium]|nr:MAG: hypothetical protein EA382_16710 [Spirochaetaceae bacterium]